MDLNVLARHRTRRVLIARRVTEAVAARARVEFDALVSDHDLTRPEAVELCQAHRIEAVVIGKKSGFGAADIAQLPDCLRIIANPSAGFDHMDVEAARSRGIVVTNAPDALTDCTADFTFLLILAASRRASEYEAIMRRGWRQSFGMPDMLGTKVSGAHLGIVGMGRIGRAVAQRARGFGMTVHYHNRTRLPADLEQGAQYHADLKSMLPLCSILSLNLPGGSAPVMTRETFALLPRGAVFVNAARGSLVDEDALFAALQSGHLFAAGLDVFGHEPDYDTRFAQLPNVFLTPHMGSATTAARDQMGFDALDNIAAVLSGNPAINPV